MKNTSEIPIKKLAAKREELTESFLKGSESNLPKAMTQVLDAYFHESYETSSAGPELILNKKPYAVIALGGYGRQEQCIHSDVDLLFLFEKHVPENADKLIQEVVYPLWDIGLDVGHATRSLENCINKAKQDIEILTALLDARFICGMSFLYSTLMEMIRKEIVLKDSNGLIECLIKRNLARHEYFGDSTYLLEPNLKEGCGGLRDYHTMLWIGRIKANLSQPRDLEYFGCLSHEEFKTLTQALSFIWNVRNRLHYIAARKCDQLYFRHQEKLAHVMNYKKQDGQQPVERFLGELHCHMNFLKQQQEMRVYEHENEVINKRKKKAVEKTLIQGINIKNRTLVFASSKIVNESPDLIIKIFEQSAILKLPLAAESKRVVTDFLHRVDTKFSRSRQVLKSFEQILLTPVPRFNVLEAMLSTGFLLKYIPQFQDIINRIQYDEYHLYPVDMHSMRTVQNIKSFGTDQDPAKKRLCADIYNDLEDKTPLLWSALFHDIGKGIPGGNHAEKGAGIAKNILKEKGYNSQYVDKVVFLVQEHLFLIKTATRRDIQDEETAIFCARKIKDPELLKMLYLLTIADSAATGPKAWNDWTAALLEGLFLNVLNILEKGELASSENVELIEKKQEQILLQSSDLDFVKSLFAIMSPRYLLHTDVNDMSAHISLYKELGNQNFVWTVTKTQESNTRTVTICAKDFPGLFSKIAGVFTLNSINILDAQIYTWRNNIALDVFQVMPPPDNILEKEKWENAEKDLKAALSQKLDIGAALKEKRAVYGSSKPKTWERPNAVMIDNKSSSFFTIIEVYTYDYPGLLFDITDSLLKCRLDIWVAKIATHLDQVVDVFYVRDFDGQKADSPKQIAAIEDAVEKSLTNLNS
ncbi:Bifunctional uridylyltransferase/uridylyl-removing enzyme [Desulfonema limicola]|uniref:Bifunctional uridylyltransferase/uridylyl-removing enzyme n=1 Tax=Desulfonema limicola TaxID=45656 RepID=A0A975BDJ9_9BACT|nr:Bifunctional uridylyltransferase/uridylyl-removing enzyme [Desulfonema limicola]